MTAARYASPLPTEIGVDYSFRIEGVAQQRRRHIFTDSMNNIVQCNPAGCRECYREQEWEAGQTHGSKGHT